MTRKLAIAVVVVVAGGVLWVFFAGPGVPPKPRAKLPDGSILTVEKVTSIAPHQYEFDHDSLWNRLKRIAPPPLSRYLPRGGGTATTSASSNAIVLWVSLFHAQSNRYVNPGQNYHFEIVDEHGCTAYLGSRGRHSDNSGFQLNSFAVERFQRRSPTFKLRVRQQASLSSRSDEVLAELEVPNPMSGPFPEWHPEPLPIARTNGDLSFVLESLNPHRSEGRLRVGARLKVLRNGEPARDWSAWAGKFTDATGNVGNEPYCTNEPAWKISARFFRNETAEFASDEMLIVTNLPVPLAGRADVRTESGVVQGVRIEFTVIAGAGHYTYSNGAVVAEAPLDAGFTSLTGPVRERFSVSRRNRNGVSDEMLEITRASPYLLLKTGRLVNDQELLIRGRDERGRLVTGNYTGRANDTTHVRLKIPKDAARLDLQFIVHRGVLEEFIVAPPRF